MELWLLLAILSYLSFAISTSIDKYFMNNGHNPLHTNTFKMFFDASILLIVGLIFFDLQFTRELALWALLLGAIYAISGVLYFKSLQLKDVEIFVPYAKSSQLLLVFIGSILIFQESASKFSYFGVFMILVGIYMVLSDNGFAIPKLDKGIFLILGVIALSTIYSLLVKGILFNNEPINLAILMYFFCTIFLMIYSIACRAKKHSKRIVFEIRNSKIFVSSFFGAMGTLLLYSALARGDASQVYPVLGLEAVFVFIIASLFLKEKFYWHRLIGTLIVVSGIYFIS